MPISHTFILLISIVLGIVLQISFKKLSLRHNILNPKGIPLTGGIGIGLSFCIACLIGFYGAGNLPKQAQGLLASSFSMLIFGLIDDWRELSIGAKFLVQIIATSMLIFFGIRTQIVYIGDILNIVITFLWVLGITNAFNHLDVLDGVAGLTAWVVSMSFLAISIFNHEYVAALLSLTIAGAVFSFLIYNFPPAKIYMGNSGSHFLGFTLASIALLISYAPMERKIALLSPLFILGLPIFDTFFLIFIRMGNRRLPYKKSNDHIALRFIKSGYSKDRTLLFMSLLSLFFCLSGVILSQVSNSLGIAVIGLVILVSLILAYRIGKVPIDG